MSAASISRSSPHSSPLGHPSRHGHLTPRSSAPRTPASVNGNLHTPLLSLNRHSPTARHEAADASPNYFNLSIEDGRSCESSAGGAHARGNFSPPSSKVRSTAAISPRVLPLDQNPEFEAFRRQSEIRGAHSAFAMALPGSLQSSGMQAAEIVQPSPPLTARTPLSFHLKTTSGTPSRGLHEKPRSPKRHLSSPYTAVTDRPRRNSPAGFNDRDVQNAPHAIHFPREDDTRFSLPTNTSGAPPPVQSSHLRSETLPTSLGREPSYDGKDGTPFVSASHVATLLDISDEGMLLLDLRVSTQYARSKIAGALNLCIPTTLLKRPSYNTQRLAETFKADDQRKRFERWSASKYIVVYDANSSRPKDALSCVNMLKKFAGEGWTGQSYIIRGGFHEFAKHFPALIEHTSYSVPSTESRSEPPGSGGLLSIAPVIGGCPMPSTKSAANPFFGNIRQNMDLIGGVGQMDVKVPSSMSTSQLEVMPDWLKLASDAKDSGKLVSDKFLGIERREQKRMQDALSTNVTYGSPGPQISNCVQIAGIEKGSKNRYNNIWPYEHSRVKLEGVAEGGCDYVNANHIKSAWSNKRYIATQGPIPTTFPDFWNVIWHQDVRVIVMLTAEKESGQIKAHNYWDGRRYGPYHVHFLSEHRAALEPSKIHRHKERADSSRRRSTNPHFGRTPPHIETKASGSEQPFVIVRRFTLSSDDEPFARMREITQLQYSNWPDFGAPAHPTHLLGLVEQTDAVVRASHAPSPSGPASEETRPILVHCSAGCGRTGTFCTVDTVIDMMKRQRAIRPSQSTGARQPTPMELDSFNSGFPSMSGGQVAPTPSSVDEKDWVHRDDLDLIEKTVEEFRLQRLSMVQSLRQFVLCYESVMEWMAEQTPKSA